MDRATPQTRSIAERLIVIETLRNASPEAAVAVAFPAIDKLRPHLATLMGSGGVRALVGRSLALATTEVPWLRAVQVDTAGNLERLVALRGHLDPAEFLEGRVVLLARLLGLLVAFIGPSLTSRLVGEVWPQVPPKDRDFGKEQDREKAK
ncbi:hypothetical protein [Phenylobacterium sp.]|uniref:hypothetical protein n=1 Tax=Phenylobacterium sp. TaxID=1871053 RepID=UPI0011F60CFD|nr:hypothetical protein [Phenylobacterium sp.]THD52524.1 MAG: hypothetical protein E8A12_19705 [Phenylobacterium sp.]